jgi:hypothetical protein
MKLDIYSVVDLVYAIISMKPTWPKIRLQIRKKDENFRQNWDITETHWRKNTKDKDYEVTSESSEMKIELQAKWLQDFESSDRCMNSDTHF